MQDRRLPVGEIEASILASELIKTPPQIGYLTISNALRWRLQYSRVVSKAGSVSGIDRIK